MTRTHWMLGSLIAGLWVAFSIMPAYAEEEGATPDPMEILRKSNAALEKVDAVYYEARVFGLGAARPLVEVLSSKVWLQKAPGKEAYRIRCEGTVAQPEESTPQPYLIASDGETVTQIDPKAKTGRRMPLRDADEALAYPKLLYMREFIMDAPLADELNAEGVEYDGTRQVGDVMCHIITVKYDTTDPAKQTQFGNKTRWFIGKEDLLPRRVEREAYGLSGEARWVRSLNNLDTTPDFKPNTFRPDLPSPEDADAEAEISEDEEADDATEQAEAANKPVVRKVDPADKPAQQTERKLLDVGTDAPDWTLKDADGNEITLSDLRGKVVLLDFWATWCYPCRKALPTIQKLHEKYKDKDVEIIGVNCKQRGRGADPVEFWKENKLTFEMVLKGDTVARDYKVRGIPSLYIIGPDGKIVHAKAGFNFRKADEKFAELSEIIDAALASK